MTTTMTIAEAFKQWVGQQNPYQKIDHHSWYDCAIGLYVATRSGEITVDDVCKSIRNLWGYNAYMFIGNGGCNADYETPWDNKAIDTMGNLYQWLDSLNVGDY